MPYVIVGIAAVAGLVVGLFWLDRLGRWMEDRGWIYYRKTQGSSTAMGNAFSALNEAFDPSVKYTETIYQKQQEEDDEGDPLADDDLVDPLRYDVASDPSDPNA